MRKLVLFDVDGTLVNSPSIGAFDKAINNLHGLKVQAKHKEIAGLTDRLILSLLLEGEGWESSRIKTHLPALIKELEQVYLQNFVKGSVQLLPGVRELLVALKKHGVTLGLITGNLRTIARTKLEDVGIWSYFTTGDLGSDPHIKRSELVFIAVKEAGFSLNDRGVYVIGDTPRDIQAASEVGVINKVGVASNLHSAKELQEAGANIVFNDFKDTKAVLKAFGFTE